jgi:predicted DsbA family dithiol-disulfide isomerase
VLIARLTRVYLAEGELLSDHPTLQRLGEEVGLPAADLARTLRGGAYAEQVRADQAGAGRREVTAVSTFLVDGRHVIPAAQSHESILATLRRAWSAPLVRP